MTHYQHTIWVHRLCFFTILVVIQMLSRMKRVSKGTSDYSSYDVGRYVGTYEWYQHLSLLDLSAQTYQVQHLTTLTLANKSTTSCPQLLGLVVSLMSPCHINARSLVKKSILMSHPSHSQIPDWFTSSAY
jgi:hypothetical protein